MLTRPPPLQLQLDNTFPVQRPLPRSHSQIRSFFTQIYKANWRNLVIAVAGINTLRYSISASNAFQDVGIDNTHHATKLARISTALGALYITIAIIQLFGVFSASSRRLKLIQANAYMAFISGLLITVAGFVAAVAYFLLAEDLIRECVTLSVDNTLQTIAIFGGKRWKSILPTPSDAQDHCLTAWSLGSISQVFSVFIFSLLPATAFFFLAYAYYRQTTDPNHPASLCISHGGGGGPNSAPRNNNNNLYPGTRYASLHNEASPTHTYSSERLYNKPRQQQQQRHVPKANPNPKTQTKQVVPARSQLSPVMMRSAQSPYMLTPGPPSFGLSRDYRSGFFNSVGSDGV